MERSIRVRAAIADHFMSILVAVVVLALLGGFVTYGAYAETTTRTETVRTDAWETTGEFTHRATVVNDTAAYDRGETLRNRSVYFTGLTPRLNGSFAYGYTSSEGRLDADVSVWLVRRSVSDDRDGSVQEHWRTETRLARERVAGLGPGDRLRVPFSTNVTAAILRAEEIDKQVGPTPGQTEVRIEARIDLSGTRNGQSVDRTRVYNMTVTRDGGIYRVADSGPTVDSGQQREERTVAVAPGPLRAFGGPVLLFVAVGACVGLAAARRRGALTVTEREREWLAYRDARGEFDEWITTVRISEPDRDATIEVESLAGLVDVAIDTDSRVLMDEERTTYLVFADDRCYTYRPPSPPATRRGLFGSAAPAPPTDGDAEGTTDEQPTVSDGGEQPGHSS